MKKIAKIDVYKGNLVGYDCCTNCYFIKTRKGHIFAKSVRKLKLYYNFLVINDWQKLQIFMERN